MNIGTGVVESIAHCGTIAVNGTLYLPLGIGLPLPSRSSFEPGPGFDAAFEVDMSGMALAAAPGEPVAVTYVVAGSPAAAASIAPGDVLVSVDGAAATPETIDAIRAALRSAPGATRRLVLRRGSQRRETTITLRRLV